MKFAEDDIEVVKKSHPKYNTGVITENSTAKMKEINPRMKRIVQIKYKRYLQENLSQNVMRRVPMIPRTPKPIKTPKNAVTAVVIILMTGLIISSPQDMKPSKPMTKFAISFIEPES